MGGSDMQFCLRWNNFGSTMTSALHTLYEGGDFVDVTLAVMGGHLGAHKLILSACSPYFRDILKSNPCPHPVIILKEVALQDLEAVLTFIYEGEVNVSQSQLHSFMKLAETLQIRGLTDAQTNRRRIDKELYQTLLPVPEVPPNDHSTAPQTPVPITSTSTSTVTSPVLTSTPHQQPRRAHESPPPPTKRRRSLRAERSETDASMEEESDLRNILEVKMEPDEEPEEVDEGGGGGGAASSSYLLADRQRDVRDESWGKGSQISRRNSSDRLTSSSNLQPEFPQDPSCQNLPYPCPFCEKAYTSWGFRRRHIKGYHTQSQELPCKWCYNILPSHQHWADHVTSHHNLAVTDARNGLLILEEAHMVLQIAQPTRIDSLMEIIKSSKKDKEEEKEDDNKEEEEADKEKKDGGGKK